VSLSTRPLALPGTVTKNEAGVEGDLVVGCEALEGGESEVAVEVLWRQCRRALTGNLRQRQLVPSRWDRPPQLV
jgi:hypothetical protein